MIEFLITCLSVIIVISLLVFMYRSGYKDGANMVIREWKQSLRQRKDEDDEW